MACSISTQSNIPGNHVLILPTELVAKTADGAVLAARFQSQYSKSLGNHHALLLVVWGRDAFESFKTLHRCSTTGGLVRDHAADSSPEDLGWGAEMERT